MQSTAETIGIEHRDRVRRLKRLSQRSDLPRPDLDVDLEMPSETLPTISYDVPVVRVRYPIKALFDVDEARLKPQAKRALRVVAATMNKGIPDSHVLVVGHTDATASVAYNQRLSERRAHNAVQYLHDLGVTDKRTGYVGMSERQPIARNDTAAGRAKNRRIEFVISTFKEANKRFARTRSIPCEYLDEREFDIGACFDAAPTRTVEVPENDPVGVVDNDPSVKDLRENAGNDRAPSMRKGGEETKIVMNPKIPDKKPSVPEKADKTIETPAREHKRLNIPEREHKELNLAPATVNDVR